MNPRWRWGNQGSRAASLSLSVLLRVLCAHRKQQHRLVARQKCKCSGPTSDLLNQGPGIWVFTARSTFEALAWSTELTTFSPTPSYARPEAPGKVWKSNAWVHTTGQLSFVERRWTRHLTSVKFGYLFCKIGYCVFFLALPGSCENQVHGQALCKLLNAKCYRLLLVAIVICPVIVLLFYFKHRKARN